MGNGRMPLLFAIALIVMTTAGTSHVRGQVPIDDDGAITSWFVQLDVPVETFRQRAAQSGIAFSQRFVYQRLWRGLSVAATGEAAGQLRRLPGVSAVFPVLPVSLGPVDISGPEMHYALAMTGADVAQDELGLTGEGVKVGIIDSGIDYHHPDLGGGFGPGFRVATGFDFVGDRYDAAASGGALIPHPDADPDDCNGHGTHVAGIVGADGDPAAGGVRGVAPHVTFGAYRVFGCDGSTGTDIMLAAMERAHADGMDVVNMSIGAGFQNWPQYPTSVAADMLVDAGVIVVVAAGNNGASGVYSAASPGVGKKVIGVASFDNSHVDFPSFTVSGIAAPVPYSQGVGAPAAPTSGSATLARTATSTTSDACLSATGVSPLPPGSLTNKVALIRRGTCGFYEKSINAQQAGAIGVVIYNNVAGLLTPNVTPPLATAPPVTIPVVAVQLADGTAIDAQIVAGETILTWTDETVAVPHPNAGRASSFSSYGLSAELDLKPNVGAPGGAIRSTLPLEIGGYGVVSGTSMSTPHVAGAVALYLEAHPGATAAQVKTALQNTADPVALSTFRDPVHRQGGGMIDIDDAIQATTTVTPSELSLGEGVAPKIHTLTIANNGTAAVTYTFSHVGAIGTFGTFPPVGLFTNAAGVSFSSPSVGVAPGGTASVDVTITPPAVGVDGYVYGGSLVVSGSDGKVYRVPYAGLTGDYQAIQVLARGGCALVPLPALFKRGGETVCVAATATAPAVKLEGAFTPQPDGTTYNVDDRFDRPVILLHLAHQSRKLQINAIDVATNQAYLVAEAEYLIRNPANTTSMLSYATFTWNGKQLFTNAAGRVHARAVPSGVYKLQMLVTKALAEEGNAAHVEKWESAPFTITRNP